LTLTSPSRACGNKWRYDSGTELGLQGAAAGANGLDKKLLSERDICTKFITPAVKRAAWDELTQIRDSWPRATAPKRTTTHTETHRLLEAVLQQALTPVA
jgi:hypothetical protein